MLIITLGKGTVLIFNFQQNKGFAFEPKYYYKIINAQCSLIARLDRQLENNLPGLLNSLTKRELPLCEYLTKWQLPDTASSVRSFSCRQICSILLNYTLNPHDRHHVEITVNNTSFFIGCMDNLSVTDVDRCMAAEASVVVANDVTFLQFVP